MCIYTYVEGLFLILLILEVMGNKSRLNRNFIFYLEAGILLLVLGFRNMNVGGDTINYVNFFIGKSSTYGSFNNYKLEPGFLIFVKILHAISSNWRWFIFITSFCSLFPFLWLVKKNCKIVTLPFLTFLLCWDLLWLIQTPIRQDIAVFFIFISYSIWNSKAIKKRIWRVSLSLIFLIFGLFTHNTMVLILPLLAICYFFHAKRKTYMMFIFGTLILTISFRSVFSNVFAIFNQLSNTLNFAERMNTYYDNSQYELVSEFNVLYIVAITTYVALLLMLSSNKQLKSFPLKCLVMGCCFYNIGFSFPLITRIVFVFTLFGASFTPNNFSIGVVNKKSLIKYCSLGVFLLLLIFYNHHINYCNGFKTRMENDILPYTFWFE